MLKRKFARALLVLSTCVLTASCAHIKIDNAEFCTDLGDTGAVCNKTLSHEPRDLSKQQWDQERFGQMCTSIDTVENWRAAILKACTKIKCTYDDKKALHNMEQKLIIQNKIVEAVEVQNETANQ